MPHIIVGVHTLSVLSFNSLETDVVFVFYTSVKTTTDVIINRFTNFNTVPTSIFGTTKVESA